MVDVLQQAFGLICGQNPAHTWAPGGLPLPFCERCTGLYVGAAAAIMLHLFLKPKLTARFLELHGVFLLLMVPLGFHWVPQGPVLRTLSGVLFAFGIVTFLRLRQGSPAGTPVSVRAGHRNYFLSLAVVLILLPVVVRLGGTVAGAVLTLLGVCGTAGLAILAGLTAIRIITDAVRWFSQSLKPVPRS